VAMGWRHCPLGGLFYTERYRRNPVVRAGPGASPGGFGAQGRWGVPDQRYRDVDVAPSNEMGRSDRARLPLNFYRLSRGADKHDRSSGNGFSSCRRRQGGSRIPSRRSVRQVPATRRSMGRILRRHGRREGSPVAGLTIRLLPVLAKLRPDAVRDALPPLICATASCPNLKVVGPILALSPSC
jgi:hypothetical protein